MHRVSHRAGGIAGLVLMLVWVGVSWGGPPNPTGSDPQGNTAGGTDALGQDTTGASNTAFGTKALSTNTTGSFNSAFGRGALRFNTTSFNSAFGFQALFSTTTGSYNTASGVQALWSNTTGNNNTASGFEALFSNTTGSDNTASGNGALYSNTTGNNNTASGNSALLSNTTGNFNTASGAGALQQNITGAANTATGAGALSSNTTGSNNTASGLNALTSNTTGNNNIAVGSGAGGNLTNGENNIYVGNPGVATESNTMRLGGTQTSTFIAGVAGVPVSGSVVAISSTGQLGITSSPIGGLNLPFSGSVATSSAAFSVTNTSGGTAVVGKGGSNGVYGESHSAIGVHGESNSSYAGYFHSDGDIAVKANGRHFAVIGDAPDYGVAGFTQNTSFGKAIYGSAPHGGYAGYFDGDVYVTGIFSAHGKVFKIDHPLDPANKYLVHSVVESPDMMAIYNGNVVTDNDGYAAVVLPSYFQALNRDFRYQLTVIGQFAQAIVASEIENNCFSIKTDKPNVKVSWQVTGIRQDVWANAHRIQVEEEKTQEERGYYLQPELFGQPEEKGIEWAHSPELMRRLKAEKQ